MRQVGIAVQLYTNDHEGHLPNTSHVRAEDGSSLSWTTTLEDYLSADFIGRCPSCRPSPSTVTYGWNDLLANAAGEGIPITRCRTPSSTLVLAESADNYTSEHFHFSSARTRTTYNQFKSSVAVERHGRGANYLFVDGHLENLSSTEIKNRLNATNSTLLNP